MPRYLVERVIPGVGDLTAPELKAVFQQTRRVQQDLATRIHWLHSMITADRLICLYCAENEDIVREHARLSGLPIERISTVSAMIDPNLDDLT